MAGRLRVPNSGVRALHEFVHARFRSFTIGQATSTLQRLESAAVYGLKPFAHHLHRELASQGMKINYTSALEAAALTLTGEGWHKSSQQNLFHTLTLWYAFGSGDEPQASWVDAGRRLVEVCQDWLRANSAEKVLHIDCGAQLLSISASTVEHSRSGSAQSIPFVIVTPTGAQEEWLNGAAAALELLRRNLEETRLCFLDGLAVPALCDREDWREFGLSVHTSDAPNSELVLIRKDHPLESGYEIVRGNELTCWGQLEAALDDGGARKIGSISIDDDGGWRCGSARFEWLLATLKPKEFVPGLIHTTLGSRDSGKLLRRYRFAKHMFGQLPVKSVAKRLDYLGDPSSTYRVNRHKLLHAIKAAGLTWESCCAEIGAEGTPLSPELSLGFVLQLVSRLNPLDPDAFFARPARAELQLAADDDVLRALMPRVDHIRYRAYELPIELKEDVNEAVAELSASLAIRRGIVKIEDPNPLPDLVFASDAEEFRQKLESWGLVVYVGVMPHIRRIPPEVELPEGVAPFAFGHSLYLDIDLEQKTGT